MVRLYEPLRTSTTLFEIQPPIYEQLKAALKLKVGEAKVSVTVKVDVHAASAIGSFGFSVTN
jgi:hypothetical protein